MVRLDLDKYNMHGEVWALHAHFTYGDSMEPLIYLRIKWWARKRHVVLIIKIHV